VSPRIKTFLGTEPIGKLLLKLSLPTIVAQIINMLYNLVDRIYIGHIPSSGSLQLTALGVCTSLILAVSAFAALVGSGGGPLASIAYGKGDHEKAEKYLGASFTLLSFIGIILTIVMLLWNRPMLLAFGASDQTIDYAVDYMNIYAIGTLFVELTLGLNMFITGEGATTTGMLSVLLGAVLNIGLDPLFIFTFNMGVKGAAWATVISQAVSCLWVIFFLCSKRSFWRLHFKNMLPSWSLIGSILFLGSATFMMQISESILTVCFNTSLRSYGGDLAVGTMTILFSLMQLAFLPLTGLGQGAQPIISYNYGAGNKERVKQAFKDLVIVSFHSPCFYGLSSWRSLGVLPPSSLAMKPSLSM
jgi:putative MATE family efflux protein